MSGPAAPVRPSDMTPRYLRVVVTPRCSLGCSYCHMEGDPARGAPRSVDFLAAVARHAAGVGVDKIKLLGGEPLLRPDLGALVGALRSAAPSADLSLITAGVAPADRLPAAFAAGLDRANLSVHGWSVAHFAHKARRGPEAHRRRQETLAWLLAQGRPTKLNYVYGGPADEADLDAFLTWAAPRPVVAAVLDDLGQDLGPAVVLDVLRRLRGAPATTRIEPDPRSLPTLRLTWADGLEVEVKHQQLGAQAPWGACAACPVRARCREGIDALRLTHDGWLRPCLDRPDLGVDLATAWARDGEGGLADAWAALVTDRVRVREAA